MINSILSAIYWKSKWTSSVYCVPSEKCIASIETIATTYPIQMVKILAKSVLCVFWSHLDHKPYQKVKLDDIEIQSFLNFFLSRQSLHQATLIPICSFMKDLITVSRENRVSFLNWNAHGFLVTVKEKSENLAVTNAIDKLMLLLMSSDEISLAVKKELTVERGLNGMMEFKFCFSCVY